MRDKLTVKTLWLLEAGVLGLALGAAAGCSSTSKTSGNATALPADVQAITFLQRTPRNDDGNVFDYANFVPGGRLAMLSPPSADGKLTVVFPNAATCAQIDPNDVDNCVSGSDVQSYDLSFDAKSVVFSAQLPGDGSYQIYSINLDGTSLQQLTSGGNDFVYPVYAPGDRVTFMTNRNVEADGNPSSMQFKDEYERATTAQVGSVTTSGTDLQLGPRNVSHRVSPALLPDGHVLYTEWMHMGEVNEGHLRMMNTDMTGMKEAFGDELKSTYPSTNSYLKARYVTTKIVPDPDDSTKTITDYQVIAVATSRDRTLQSGKLFLIDLNGSEANSASLDLTPLIPGDRSPSSQGIGRYYDAEPVGDEAPGQFLTSWADGPVQSEELDRAMSTAQFGIYVLDAANANASNGGRSPIYDDPNYWDVLPRPVKMRPEPANLASDISKTDTSTTVGCLNVYQSSLLTIPQGSVAKVRLIEGFSGEEGGVDMFGTTEFDGQSKYGEIPIQGDASFAADVPANVPLHIQLVDKFGMATQVSGSHGTATGTPVANEDIWFSGRSGESRFCGGCHENRTVPSSIQPGATQAVIHGPVNLDAPRAARQSTTAYALTNGALPAGTNAANPGDNDVRGVPWDLAIQPILDKHCISCHDGSTSAQNPTYTVMDMTSGTSQTFTFDLRGQKLNVTVGERMTGDFTASYLSLMGLGEILGDDVVKITGTPPNYVVASAAEVSPLMYLLNPPQRYPVDTNTRAFGSVAFTENVGGTTTTYSGTPHLVEQGQADMTPDEYYLLELNIDMGGQYFFRENLDEAGTQ
jgi:Hydrazine synthase alpha subunit middle domain